MRVGNPRSGIHRLSVGQIKVMSAASKLILMVAIIIKLLLVSLPQRDVLFPEIEPIGFLNQEPEPLAFETGLALRVGVPRANAITALERGEHDAGDAALL